MDTTQENRKVTGILNLQPREVLPTGTAMLRPDFADPWPDVIRDVTAAPVPRGIARLKDTRNSFRKFDRGC